MPLNYSLVCPIRQGVFEKIFEKMQLFVAASLIVPEKVQKHTVYNLPKVRYNTKIKKYIQIPVYGGGESATR